MIQHRAIVTVEAETVDQAEDALFERTNYDEDYGFPYTIKTEPLPSDLNEWLQRATEATGDAGSNDAEHDCLIEAIETISAMIGVE